MQEYSGCRGLLPYERKWVDRLRWCTKDEVSIPNTLSSLQLSDTALYTQGIVTKLVARMLVAGSHHIIGSYAPTL